MDQSIWSWVDTQLVMKWKSTAERDKRVQLGSTWSSLTVSTVSDGDSEVETMDVSEKLSANLRRTYTAYKADGVAPLLLPQGFVWLFVEGSITSYPSLSPCLSYPSQLSLSPSLSPLFFTALSISFLLHCSLCLPLCFLPVISLCPHSSSPFPTHSLSLPIHSPSPLTPLHYFCTQI